jgi:RNA polymerase sigma-70 factor (ECF subfamily)
MNDDQLLIKELCKGNEKAFVELYEKYWEKLYYVCYQRILSKEETEDIIHELFLDLWNKKDSLEIRSTFAAYIFTALKYKIFRLIDSKSIRRKYIGRMGDEEPASENTTEQLLDFNELYDLIEQRIENLPEKCKLIFRMSRDEYLSAEEISKKLNISSNTVQNQITKAKKVIKNQLKKLFFFILI